MSIHIGAQEGDVADAVLLPGDPLRARYVAESFLEDATCYNEVRGMLGYTGTWNGKRISVQGTGMGIPSHLIYVHELIVSYGARKLIRVGSCGALQPDMNLHDIVFAMTASTDSQINRFRFAGADFAPCADFELFHNACRIAGQRDMSYRAGNILSTDRFYHEREDYWKDWAQYGVLAIEMETNALYTEAAKYGVQALSILTVSDSLVHQQFLSPEDRERSFRDMMELALEIA